VVKGDAAEWARKSRHAGRRQQYVSTNNNSALHAMDYQVLLVDPPRMGLDNVVCEMANKGTFEHIFYISCGRKALQRDLIILGEHFDVMDCTLLDLFPRTDSVESLVHLERRQPSVVADGCEHFTPLYE
jgi:tRNA/tmRNA/rRNA uracil-C5-methylase (TrmA/RlmC/RlmD family)